MKFFTRISVFAFLLSSQSSFSQTLPVGTPVLEETWRRMQISGNRDLNTSFTVRPIQAGTADDFDSLYNPLNFLQSKRAASDLRYAKGKGVARILPATLVQQYNTHHPYGWNDGAMIQARGYQLKASVGVYTRIGPLTVQAAPEFVYAQNRDFSTFPYNYPDSLWAAYYGNVLNSIDNPERYGTGAYVKMFPGQSSIKLNFKQLAIGISTENLWWGPGIRNSLIMSNNAPGFAHISFNTTAPVMSPVGSFEWQVVSGTLKGSGILPPDTGRTFNGQALYQPKPDDDRYLNGMVLTYQPRWTKGLYLGFTRMFYQYNADVEKSFDGILPVLGSLFKGSTNNEDAKKRDQLISFFFRLVLPKEKAEFYAEFGRNDHAQNLRDLALEPEHSRAYIIGGRKIFTTAKNTDVELAVEMANLQMPSTGQLRAIPGWYTHAQVVHGFTNRGQVIGAGIGPGASSQTVSLNWIKGIRKTGISFERVVRNNDFYYQAFTSSQNFGSHWVDLSVNATRNWFCKRFIYTANLSFVRSLNYQWRHDFDANGDPVNRDFSNVHANVSVSYLF